MATAEYSKRMKGSVNERTHRRRRRPWWCCPAELTGQGQPKGEADEKDDDTRDSGEFERVGDRHGPQNFGELSVGQRQSPETEVRSGVRDTAQAELDGMNDLVNGDFSELELLLLRVILDNQFSWSALVLWVTVHMA